MDDLIYRKAAIEAVKIPNGGCINPSERHGIIIARVEARRAIQSIPSVQAVPLDTLCDLLSKHLGKIRCKDCCVSCSSSLCPRTADDWRRVVTKWMEGLDEKQT